MPVQFQAGVQDTGSKVASAEHNRTSWPHHKVHCAQHAPLVLANALAPGQAAMARGRDSAVAWVQALVRDVDTNVGAEDVSHKLEVQGGLPHRARCYQVPKTATPNVPAAGALYCRLRWLLQAYYRSRTVQEMFAGELQG